MNILAFDTCFDACSVAVRRDDGAVIAERVLMRRGHAEALLPMIERTMQAAGRSFGDLARIAVTHGPGTFTGTRVGMAAALGLALANDIPVVTYSSLLCIARAAIVRLAESAKADERADASAYASNYAGEYAKKYGGVVVVHDAKRDSVFMEIVDMHGQAIAQPALLSSAEARASLKAHAPVEPYFAIGSGIVHFTDQAGALPAGVVAEWPRMNVASAPSDVHDLEIPDARYLLQDAASRAPASPPRPLYLRAPDATPSSVPPLARLPAAHPPGHPPDHPLDQSFNTTDG